MASKRIRLDLKTKYQMLKDIDKNVSRDEIVQRYHLKNKSNINRILGKKNEIAEAFENGSLMKRKSLKKGKFQVLERETLKFVSEMNTRGVNITVTELEVKAQQVIKEKGIIRLKGERGYIGRVMKRNVIGWQIKHGESLTVPPATVEDWKKQLPEIIMD